MDLVSLDTQQEYDWIKGFMNGKESGLVTTQLKFNSSQRPLLLDLREKM